MLFPIKESFIFDHTKQAPYPTWTPPQTQTNLNARSEEMRLAHNALVGALNSTGEDNWLYQQIANAILGQVADGSQTDVKLSDAAGQIKERVANLLIEYAAFVATKGMPGGIGTLDTGGLVPFSQMPSYLLFGDGHDGTATITVGTTTLYRDMFYENLTINSGAILKTAGYKVFVRGTLTNNGTIDNSGGNGVNGGTTAYQGGTAGVGGGDGGGGGGARYGVIGTLGGGGGKGGGYMYSGALEVNPDSPVAGVAFSTAHASSLAILWSCQSFSLGGGTGGNGGLQSAVSYQGAGLYGGGGGGGGGKVHLYASTIINNGIISSKGGNGGIGGWANASYYAGGGGGGGGGFVLLAYRVFSGNDPVVTGGALGVGGVSNATSDGTAGIIGIVKKVQML